MVAGSFISADLGQARRKPELCVSDHAIRLLVSSFSNGRVIMSIIYTKIILCVLYVHIDSAYCIHIYGVHTRVRIVIVSAILPRISRVVQDREGLLLKQ